MVVVLANEAGMEDPSDAEGQQEYSVSLQILLIMTALSFIPAFVMLMTSFTRIIIVFSILRQALGLQQTPSNQILIGLTLFLTLFIMAPVLENVYEDAFMPVQDGEISFMQGIENARIPLQEFMVAQTREQDVLMFMEMAEQPAVEKPEDIPFTVLMPAFITSELKTAFTIGFLIYIPFIIIDLVVASVLMSMGMMMLSPMMISLPFKLLLFVLVDGWGLVTSSLVATFLR